MEKLVGGAWFTRAMSGQTQRNATQAQGIPSTQAQLEQSSKTARTSRLIAFACPGDRCLV